MPLHEYEEKKRRQNIDVNNASGACHICGSTARNTKGFSHCLDHENSAQQQQPRYHYNEMGTSLIPAPQTAPMRSCACFNQSKSDPDYWPFSLRVCEMCIADDCTTGRVRNCGICGAVACDENCGVEMAECTDNEGWNNMGCLECRRKECFSEIDVFKTPTECPDGSVPKMTRVCVKCLEQCTPWVKYDFTCRLFKCNTRLVPSDVMERKRFRTFDSSPLNLLPEDGLAAIVDFLPNSDLKSLYLTNSAMCHVSERVARTRVERFHHDFPTGPLVVGTRKSPFGSQDKQWIRCEGTNDFNVRAPEDGKVWVGILHYLECIAKEAFYLGFQIHSRETDDVVCRFMQKQDKFQFSQVYIRDGPNTNSPLIPRPEQPNSSSDGISICSSFILITDASVKVPFVVASSEDLVSGKQRFICRLFCPGSGTKNSNRDSLGSYGILCKSVNDAGVDTITWAKRLEITEGFNREDSVFGLEYDTETRVLIVHNHRMNRFVSSEYTLPEDTEGDLVFGVEFTAKAAGIKDSLMSARTCNEDEWASFIEYTQNGENGPIDPFHDGLDMLGLVRQRRREQQDGEDNRQERVRARLDNLEADAVEGRLRDRIRRVVRGRVNVPNIMINLRPAPDP
mmetsp:Transcript_17282/g.28276  ORF Transcript_17282/g.28276 Transcript_17282/m.28276 type:complete len:623 (+) Transcript_17282:70-1938(+)